MKTVVPTLCLRSVSVTKIPEQTFERWDFHNKSKAFIWVSQHYTKPHQQARTRPSTNHIYRCRPPRAHPHASRTEELLCKVILASYTLGISLMVAYSQLNKFRLCHRQLSGVNLSWHQKGAIFLFMCIKICSESTATYAAVWDKPPYQTTRMLTLMILACC